jgi:site-specific DNA-methyltransferase (adenine-specific)
LNSENWTLSVWNITNVLRRLAELRRESSPFPDQIPSRLIKLFTFAGETMFDSFLQSGTTLKVARELGGKGVGYEIDLELKDVIKKSLD